MGQACIFSLFTVSQLCHLSQTHNLLATVMTNLFAISVNGMRHQICRSKNNLTENTALGKVLKKSDFKSGGMHVYMYMLNISIFNLGDLICDKYCLQTCTICMSMSKLLSISCQSFTLANRTQIVLQPFIIYCWCREWARWGKPCIVIGYTHAKWARWA